MSPAYSALAALGLAIATVWAPTSLAQSMAPDQPAAVGGQQTGPSGGPDRGGSQEEPRGRSEQGAEAAAPPTRARVHLTSKEFPLVRGEVVLRQTGPAETAVIVTVYGLEPGSTHVNHIHNGSCTGSILYPRADLVADHDGVARSASLVHAALDTDTWWLNVHAGYALPSPGITCGKVEAQRPRRTEPGRGPGRGPDDGPPGSPPMGPPLENR